MLIEKIFYFDINIGVLFRVESDKNKSIALKETVWNT